MSTEHRLHFNALQNQSIKRVAWEHTCCFGRMPIAHAHTRLHLFCVRNSFDWRHCNIEWHFSLNCFHIGAGIAGLNAQLILCTIFPARHFCFCSPTIIIILSRCPFFAFMLIKSSSSFLLLCCCICLQNCFSRQTCNVHRPNGGTFRCNKKKKNSSIAVRFNEHHWRNGCAKKKRKKKQYLC